jgi:hypothetical protein
VVVWSGGSDCEEKNKEKERIKFCLLLSDYKYIHKRDVSSYFRDTISSSKEVTNSVHLDPWHAGNCSVCFGRCALFATKIQFASAGIFSSFGPSMYRSMSCPFWVICSCASRLHSNDRLCLNQVCWWVAPKTKRCQEQVKLAEREDVLWQAGKA